MGSIMTIKSLLILCVAPAALMSATSAAHAGGSVASVVDLAPIEVAFAPAIGPWEGAYAGGALGYSFGGDDEVGLQFREGDAPVGRQTGLGKIKINGLTAAAQVGYRWQRDRWVFGPELGAEFGAVMDDIEITVGSGADAVSGDVESEINNILSLVMKTGYAVDPQTLVFGTFGVSRVDGDYKLSTEDGSSTVGYNATGLTAGFGVERMINETTSVFGAYQYRDFGTSNVDFTDGDGVARTVGTPSHSNIKVGFNVKF
ncbi:porin family protein [Paracoccus gahaiensis]|uniref:Porin family protein n=2 Tax=Paracoccus gahaiensis TaxID=1706839 RepID=A0A4U0RBG1_9RHOB|nr:porin family protein [Paracoccus gahaiensis]